MYYRSRGNGILTCQKVRLCLQVLQLWKERYSGYTQLWRERHLTSQEVWLYLHLWREGVLPPTAVRKKVFWVVEKSGCTWSWSLVGDGLHPGCGNLVLLWERAITADPCSIPVSELHIPFFSAPAEMLLLLQSAKGVTLQGCSDLLWFWRIVVPSAPLPSEFPSRGISCFCSAPLRQRCCSVPSKEDLHPKPFHSKDLFGKEEFRLPLPAWRSLYRAF